MRIVGVDPSLTCTGVCIMDEHTVLRLFSIKTKRTDSDYSRQCQMVNGVRDILRKGDVVVLEDFAFAARGGVSGKAAERIEICGMIKFLAPLITGCPFFEVRPSHLKSFATGRSTSHKSDVVFSVRMDWGQDVANNDEADAFILAQMGRVAIWKPEELYIGSKRRAVEKLERWKGNPFAMRQLQFFQKI